MNQISQLQEIMTEVVEIQNRSRFGGQFPNLQTVNSHKVNTATVKIGRYIEPRGGVYSLLINLRTGKLESSDLFEKLGQVEEFELFDDWKTIIEDKYSEIQAISLNKEISMNYFIEDASDYLAYLKGEDKEEEEEELEEID